MQKNEGSKVVKWILIAISVLFAFVFLILPLYTVISIRGTMASRGALLIPSPPARQPSPRGQPAPWR